MKTHKRVHVGGQGTRMSRTCKRCKQPRPMAGGTCQPGRPFICAECLTPPSKVAA